MKRQRLTREEKEIEDAVVRGEYKPVSPELFKKIVEAVERRRKDAVISLRLNSKDLDIIRKKAQAQGIPYQTLISELLHHYAMQ